MYIKKISTASAPTPFTTLRIPCFILFLFFVLIQSRPLNKFSKRRSMSRKVCQSGESGACNVCAAPCSSCMHLSEAFMDSKNDEFSDETCRLNVTSQYSVTGVDTSSSVKSKRCGSSQPATSETSNPMSVSSSHDSLSENADSKAALRSSDDALEIGRRPPSSSAPTTGEVGLSPKPLSSLHPAGFLNKHGDSKSLQAHDDDFSCVSRATDAYVAVTNSSRNVDRKNISCSSTSDSSLGIDGSKKRLESISFDTSPSKDGDASSNSPKVQNPYLDVLVNISLNVCGTDFEEDQSFLCAGKSV